MTLPSEMDVIEITGAGAPEVLQPARRPVPMPGAGQIVIRVAYAGVNRPDVLQRMGAYKAPPDASEAKLFGRNVARYGASPAKPTSEPSAPKAGTKMLTSEVWAQPR